MNAGFAQMRRIHHGAQSGLDRALRIGQEVGDARQRLVRLGIKDVQDRADQKAVRSLFPMVAAALFLRCPGELP